MGLRDLFKGLKAPDMAMIHRQMGYGPPPTPEEIEAGKPLALKQRLEEEARGGRRAFRRNTEGRRYGDEVGPHWDDYNEGGCEGPQRYDPAVAAKYNR